MPPLYEFHCNECNHDFDSLMRPYDPVECPSCKARITEMNEGGKITKKFSVTSSHVWNCSTDGAMPRRGK
jgi:putative FmdB family regulatory protein